MIPSAANSDYPKFVADQVLTSDNLNDLFGYLDEQGRMTRTNLIGMGIVCGLQVKTAADGSSITITKGVGVTSKGYLVSIPEIKYTRRTTDIFDAVKCEYYDRFVNIADKAQKFNLWELKQEAEETDTTPLTNSFLQDQDKIVLLFVELLEENNKNCDPDSCDDKGITITVNFRPLLIAKASVDSFLSNSSNTGTGNAVLLPEYKMRRYDVPATLLLDTEDIMQGYLDILTQPFIDGVKAGIANAYTILETLISDEIPAATFQSFINTRFASLAFLNDGSISQTQAVNLQYYYDFFSDLALAYDELRHKVQATVCACLPDEDLFPRHLLLGEAIAFDEQKSLYRTRFISSPVLCCCAEETKAVKMLFKKILLLLENLFIPTDDNNPNKRGIPVRITPSTMGREPLSEKAIPFYYTVNQGAEPLYQNWSFKRVADHTENQLLSYHSGDYNTQDDFVMHPLKYDLEPNNFLRIEGHIGKDYKTVITGLDKLKKTNRLPFEIVALSSDTRSIFSILSAVRSMETTGSIAAAFAEMIKHPCCFADLFLALDSWITRFRCCLAEQKRFYLAQPSFTVRTNLAVSNLSLSTNFNTGATEAAPDTIGQVYEERVKAGTINNQFCSDIFVNIATGKALPGQGLIMMPYKIDRVYEILPDHISKLDAVELEKRTVDLTGTASHMSTLYASPNVAGTMVGVNLVELQNRLRMSCVTCLLQELRTLIREFMLRLLGLMIRQKFGFYAYKNPGINHKAGVPMGGTFILVYHEESERSQNVITGASGSLTSLSRSENVKVSGSAAGASVATTGLSTASLSTADQPLLSSVLLLDEIQFLQQVMKVKENQNEVLDPLIESLKVGTVIADFYLPYLCCSDCAPTQMLVLSETVKPNQPPVARPGDNISIELPANSVILDGSSSTDPDGTIQKYFWEKQSGSNAKIETPDESKTVVSELVEGKYEFKLTVTDDLGATNSAIVSVTVLPKPNLPPIAKANVKPNVVTLNADNQALAVLDGSESKDPDGIIISFNWSLPTGSGGAIIIDPDKPGTEVKFTKPGAYLFTLTVKDDKGAAGIDTVLVTVNERQNQPPVAKATANPAVVVMSANGSASSILDASNSSDPDGTIVSFTWVLSGGTGAVIRDPGKPKTEVQFSRPGLYEFTLTVKDDKGATATDKVTVTVNDIPNQPPVAKASANPSTLIISPTAGTGRATLSSQGSVDPDGDAINFKWTLSGGPSSAIIQNPNVANTDVLFSVPGVYTFTLTVTDSKGSTGTTTVIVTVQNVPNQPPIAKATVTPSAISIPVAATAPVVVQLDGSGSIDTDGTIVSFQWSLPGGTPGAVINSPSTAKSSVQISQPGNYVFTLLVTDDKGATSSATVSVVASQDTAPQKNCAPLSKIISEFTGLRNADTVNFATFARLYTDFREIENFYGKMQQAAVANMPVANQIAFFVGERIEIRLPLWIDNLRLLIQERTDIRLLCLLMLNLHAELANYISCIQKTDVNNAEVKMNNAFISLVNLLRAIQPLVPNFFPNQRSVLTTLKNNTDTERKRIRNNGEEGAKPKNMEFLNTVFDFLRSMNV